MSAAQWDFFSILLYLSIKIHEMIPTLCCFVKSNLCPLHAASCFDDAFGDQIGTELNKDELNESGVHRRQNKRSVPMKPVCFFSCSLQGRETTRSFSFSFYRPPVHHCSQQDGEAEERRG